MLESTLLMTNLTLLTPVEMELRLAQQLKTLRLFQGLKRETLALRAGVSSASLKRFEMTGKISLSSFLKLAHALGRLDEISSLFQTSSFASMAELESRSSARIPQRGRK